MDVIGDLSLIDMIKREGREYVGKNIIRRKRKGGKGNERKRSGSEDILICS